MSRRSLSETLLVLLCTVLVAGCEVVALSLDTGTGLIVVRFEGDGPSRREPWRMRVRQAGQPERIVTAEPGEPVELTVPASGPAELTLLTPVGCRAIGANPRIVEPAADATVTARFTVRCDR